MLVDKFDDLYMEMAKNVAKMSYCKRRQVGSVAVRDGNLLSFGYNGSLRGHENNCEDAEGKTHSNVVHAEQNMICKAARDGVSLKDSTVYVTTMPCVTCSNLLIQAGIKRVVVLENYRDDKGFKTLGSSLNNPPIQIDFCDMEALHVMVREK